MQDISHIANPTQRLILTAQPCWGVKKIVEGGRVGMSVWDSGKHLISVGSISHYPTFSLTGSRKFKKLWIDGVSVCNKENARIYTGRFGAKLNKGNNPCSFMFGWSETGISWYICCYLHPKIKQKYDSRDKIFAYGRHWILRPMRIAALIP